jgi:beta-lactamase class A
VSNKALEILSTVEFRDGLRAKLPPEIKIAHKFGERGTRDGFQLHDCGIVYYPERPYLLCVMTRGQDMDSLKEVIQDISFMVYSEVSKSTYK